MDPMWIAAIVVMVALVGVGLWWLARAEVPPELPDPSDPSDAPASSASPAAPPPPVAGPAEDDGTTLGEDAAPSGRTAALLGTEVEVEVEHDELVGSSGPLSRFVVAAAGRTDRGRRRPHNEDALALEPARGLFVVADGMGGYAAGEVASQLAVDTLVQAFANGDFGGAPIPGLPRRGDELVRAIQTANAAILAQARANEAQAGMGTTVVAARFAPERRRVYLAHVGDSRAYRLRAGALVQLTADHTLGAAGVTGPTASKLSRAVGVFEEVEVDLHVEEPQPGDLYLLCSDGLFKMVAEPDLAHLLGDGGDLDGLAARLIDEANARGGRDNVSVILARIDAPRA